MTMLVSDDKALLIEVARALLHHLKDHEAGIVATSQNHAAECVQLVRLEKVLNTYIP